MVIQLGDPNATIEYRQSLVKRMSRKPSSFRVFFWDMLSATSNAKGFSLVEPACHFAMHHMSRAFAWLSQVANVERDHRLSKDILQGGKQQKFEHFSAMHVITCARRSLQAEQASLKMQLAVLSYGFPSTEGGSLKKLKMEHEPHASSSDRWLRKQSPLDLYRYDRMNKDKGQQNKQNIYIAMDFQKSSDAQKAEYLRLSNGCGRLPRTIWQRHVKPGKARHTTSHC